MVLRPVLRPPLTRLALCILLVLGGGSGLWAGEADRNRVQARSAESARFSVGLGWALAPDGTGGGQFAGQVLAGWDHPAGWSLSASLPASWSLDPSADPGPIWGPISGGLGYRAPAGGGWRVGASVAAPWAGASRVPWVSSVTAALQLAADPVVVGLEAQGSLPWPGTYDPGRVPVWFGALGLSLREVLNDRAVSGWAVEVEVVPDGGDLRWGLGVRWSFQWIDEGWSAVSAWAPGGGGGVFSGSVLREF